MLEELKEVARTPPIITTSTSLDMNPLTRTV
jgi:hypothetical protein